MTSFHVKLIFGAIGFVIIMKILATITSWIFPFLVAAAIIYTAVYPYNDPYLFRLFRNW